MAEYLPEGKRTVSEYHEAPVLTPQILQEAMEKGLILEARATVCDSDHNLYVDLGCMRGVIPREEGAVGIREGTVRDIAVISRVGRPVCFIVKEIRTDGIGRQTAILSRAEAQRRCLEEFIADLIPGDVIGARVTHMEPFGAFCDIGCGVVALMPIDTISISRIEHPDERFRVGMDIRAAVKTHVGGRITLTHKELLGTWQENADRFCVGETVTGVVRSIENYGAFIELTPNLAGLSEPHEGLRTGAAASVYIKSIIPQKMKIKLIVIDRLEEAPQVTKPQYFCSEKHIDQFVYSPQGCDKYIATDFSIQ